jgi:hypothetical protein
MLGSAKNGIWRNEKAEKTSLHVRLRSCSASSACLSSEDQSVKLQIIQQSASEKRLNSALRPEAPSPRI